MSVKQAQVCCSIQWIYSCSVYLYQCVMAVKPAGVSLALPSVKGLGGCLSNFRHISFFISLYKEQCIMKGKCKRASLSWKLLTKSRLLRVRTLVSSCENALVRRFFMVERSEISGKGKWWGDWKEKDLYLWIMYGGSTVISLVNLCWGLLYVLKHVVS